MKIFILINVAKKATQSITKAVLAPDGTMRWMVPESWMARFQSFLRGPLYPRQRPENMGSSANSVEV
jgi:hypothetical protein